MHSYGWPYGTVHFLHLLITLNLNALSLIRNVQFCGDVQEAFSDFGHINLEICILIYKDKLSLECNYVMSRTSLKTCYIA